MNEYLLNINGTNMHIEYVYIPPQKEKYPDTEPLRSYVEIDSIYVYHKELVQGVGVISSKVDITDIMLECADDWLIELETKILEEHEESIY